MREQEAHPVRELKVGARSGTGVIRPYGQAGQYETERLDAWNMKPMAAWGKDLALLRRLVAKAK